MVHEDPDDVGQGRHELLLTTGMRAHALPVAKLYRLGRPKHDR
jgi:hypothetical protein